MKNDNKALESIGIALGLRGASQKKSAKAAKRFTGRPRGKPIDLDVRKNIAMRLLMGRDGDTYRDIASDFGVSLGSIANIKKRIVELTEDEDNDDMETRLFDALRDRKRCGGAAKRRKIGNGTLEFSRQRVQRQLPRQALTEKNIKWRKEFVKEWFDGANGELVGTNDEQHDQQKNWQLRVGGERGVSSC
jgi:hypothetical protein